MDRPTRPEKGSWERPMLLRLDAAEHTEGGIFFFTTESHYTCTYVTGVGAICGFGTALS